MIYLLILLIVLLPLVVLSVFAWRPSLAVRAAAKWIRRSISQAGFEGEIRETPHALRRARFWSRLFLIYWILLLIGVIAGIGLDPKLRQWLLQGNF